MFSVLKFYVLPEQERNIIATFKTTSTRHLQTLSTIVVSPLLKKQFAALYEILDSQLANNPNWKSIRLVTSGDEVIYPLSDWSGTLNQNEMLIETNIVFLDTKLGKLTLITNYTEDLAHAHQQRQQFLFMLLGILMILIVISLFFIEKTITKPLQQLSKAFAQLSSQDYDYALSVRNQDEIADVVSDFKKMRNNIRDYQTNLNNYKDELQLFARIFSETYEGIVITDVQGIIVNVNPTFCDITGYSREEVIGKNPNILSSGKQSSEFYAAMWQSLAEHGHWQGEVWNRKKDGALYAEMLTISSLLDKQGNVLHYVGLFTDITHSKDQQQALELMAHYDVLTKLPNRALLADRFIQAVANSNRNQSLLAVCFLDLDHFKPVNDNYGHEIGDQLLIEVAERIKLNVREGDTVSRPGGDEFVLLLGEFELLAHCEQTLNRIHHALAQPFFINGQTLKIGASSGVALYPSDNADLDSLIRHADQAMYHAKLAGRNRYHVFNPDEDQLLLAKQQRLQELQEALLHDEFCLYYQPKINMKTGSVMGAEALIRWQHPEQGLIPPIEFLPDIDGKDLEIQLGDWVIETALKQLDEWTNLGHIIELSINISSYHLLSSSFIAKLEMSLARHPNIAHGSLQLEILESSVLSDLKAISSTIKTCQEALGIQIALDDFGTGYSSLTHLRNLPATTLKIDQSFVRDILEDPSDYVIIDGVIGLANAFNRQIIAEGVETTEQGLMLLLMGCEYAQGYGIARPMPAVDFLPWLKHYTPNQKWMACGNKVSSPKESSIQLFKLAAEQWFKLIEHNIQASPPDTIDHWPIMEHSKCHQGIWIERTRQEQLFEENCLNQLEAAHQALHHIAYDLINQFQAGEIDKARKGLPVFKEAYGTMINLLRLCENPYSPA
jgi:diguanylate cyclase (GGDEF)-like protein/PAS domain S-box-containing protein